MRLHARYRLRLRYALRSEMGFISYRSAAISNGHRPYIEFACKYIETPDREDLSFQPGAFIQFKSKYMGTQSLTKVPRSPYMELAKVWNPRRR